VLLYLLVSIKAGFEIAAWFMACGLIGYLNAVVVGPVLVSVVRKTKVRAREKGLFALALACSTLLFLLGYGVPLLLCTLSFLLIYWTILLFA